MDLIKVHCGYTVSFYKASTVSSPQQHFTRAAGCGRLKGVHAELMEITFPALWTDVRSVEREK